MTTGGTNERLANLPWLRQPTHLPHGAGRALLSLPMRPIRSADLDRDRALGRDYSNVEV